MLPGDIGQVRVGETERSGGQGDDDDAGREERVALGSAMGRCGLSFGRSVDRLVVRG
ncbi:hypothetical protein [Streptomyces sp. ITFR-6]|uniref:hypothetical protein n=1 Tax=Streptomyces sp. ITFR-6 TaxID=3075197 RepID=UPI002889BE92|nr:hypothetical protein [Streptomyces sp. ITFR-6]WNI30343.1 hypothetical protein RLT59_17220 [Streptomyces sp. ITFR-6]